MQPRISIVIPTWNEMHYLPTLLGSIYAQDFEEYEIIIADKQSKDRTRELARAFKCKVVDGGGFPSRSRNLGAEKARGEWILFLDADVLLPAGFLSSLMKGVQKEKVGIATVQFTSLSGRVVDLLAHKLFSLVLRVMKNIKPMAPGFCIFVKRNVHEKIKGFNEELRLCEDHDYVERASKVIKFGVLASPYVFVSVRRLDFEKRHKLVWKYVKTTVNHIFGRVEQNNKIVYEFGKY